MKFSRSNLLQPETALAVFLLVYALLAGLFYKGVPVDATQMQNWYYNYSLGYNHRGFMGSVFQFFYGEPVQEVVRQVIPRWDYNLLRALIIITWALLAAPILFIRRSRRQKLFLLAVAAVLLLAPVWRINAINIGFLDKWILLVSLGAIIAIVLRRPFIYLIFCLTGLLIHSVMIFYALLFVMLIVHAVYFIEAYREKYKQWLAAAVFPLLISLLLYFLHNAQNYMDTLRASDFDPDMIERLNYNMLNPEEYARIVWLNELSFMARNAALGLLIFGGPPVLFSVLTALVLYKNRMMEFRSHVTKRLGGKIPLLAAAEKYQLFILLPLASVFYMPIHIPSVDWSRYFYWGWWGIALTMIYLIWAMHQCGGPLPSEPKKRPQKHVKKQKNSMMIPAPVIALFFAWAYLYGGAPLSVSHLHAPWVFFCQQFCISGLTVHRPGEIYANAVFTTLKEALLPIRLNAKQIRNKDPKLFHSSLIKLENDKMIVPAEYKDFVSKFFFVADGSKPLIVTADYEAEGIPGLYLSVYGQRLQPLNITNSRAQWRFVLPFGNPGHGFADFQMLTEGGVPFAVTGISVKYDEK